VARLGHPGKGGGRVKTVVAYIDGRKRLDGVITLDNTTLGEYVAEDSSSDRIDAVIAALSGTVSVKVYDGSGVEKASGTLGSPWATNVSGQLVVGALSSFSVTGAGTPDAGWYLRFESGARWVRGSFGLKGSGQEFTWSQSTWAVGHTGRIGNVVMLAPTNAAPSWSGAPSTLSLYAGQTYNFAQHASDPNSDPLTFTLAAGSGDGYSLTSAGVLTIGAVSKSVTIRASDGVLTADHVCAVTVQAATTENRRLITNFGDGVSIVRQEQWTTGAYYLLTGTDASTGFTFDDQNPSIYGRNTTDTWTSGGRSVFQMLTPSGHTFPAGGVGTRNVSNNYWTFRFEPISDHPLGIGTALYIERKLAYSNSAQIPWHWHPDLYSVAQGMFYVRFWRKYKAGYHTALAGGGTVFDVMCSSKTRDWTGGNPDRPMYCRAQGSPLTTKRFLADSQQGSTNAQGVTQAEDTFRGAQFNNWAIHRVDGTNQTHIVASVADDTWYKFEFAFRSSTSDSVGWQWAAVNGVQAAFAQGRTIPDRRRPEVNRYTPVTFYNDGSQSGDSRLGSWYTGVEVWEGWPSDAAPHPEVS
jgi:hypothetical protein